MNCHGDRRGSAAWRKSSFSETGSCVEVSPVDGGFAVRDSKHPGGPVLRPIIKGWATFIGRVSTGEFNLPG
jgi:hypothetical protein